MEVLTPKGDNLSIQVETIFDGETGQQMEVAPHPQQIVRLPSSIKLPPMSMLRRIQ
ncbi:hypothetical protein N752_03875 [Desulforamulus aquiferis]|nr:hypothetical protein N752_03875 [Desulforamulus aquiferis]